MTIPLLTCQVCKKELPKGRRLYCSKVCSRLADKYKATHKSIPSWELPPSVEGPHPCQPKRVAFFSWTCPQCASYNNNVEYPDLCFRCGWTPRTRKD